jgi:ribonuclease P protein component
MNGIKFRLTKSERLCHIRDIDNLFENGRWLKSTHLRFIYLELDEKQQSPVKVLFTAPKKLHRHAVSRNLLKRRMREAYRLNKHPLIETMPANNTSLHIAFSYSSAEIVDYKTIELEIKQLLAQVISRIGKRQG